MQTKKPSFRNKLMLGTSIAMSMAVAAPTIAQDQTTDEDVFALEEILVTATKRSESLQDVGMSITAMSALDIERSGATEFIDYAVKVPNLSFAYESDGRFDANSPSIRGVFGRNTTGFYIDDTPVPASMNPRAIDMERIEVLRGPQGSLYGARSMGGTIRLITKQPDFDDQEVKVHAKVSSVNEGDWNWSFDGSFNMPLVEDKFAIRANAYYGKNSGIFDRKHNPVTRKGSTPEYKRQDNVDDEEYAGIQIFGKAQLSENLTFSPKFMFQSVNADGLPYADIDPENTLQKRFYDLDEPGKDRWFMASGTFNWDLDHGSVTSSTSYFDRYIDEREDQTEFLEFLLNDVIGVPTAPAYSPVDENVSQEIFSHETRYTSDFDGKFQFTAGIFYQSLKQHLQYPLSFAHGISNDAPFVTDDFIYRTDSFFNVKEIAGFGELTYDMTDMVSITVGGRWYDTQTDLNADADGFANSGPSTTTGEQSESGFNPKVLVEVAPSDNLNLYATASKGYRIGGINGNLSETLCGAELQALGVQKSDVEVYNSDSLWSYEAGVKTSSSDNRFSLNSAAYFIKWSDIQQINRLGCGFQYTANAGEAEIKGFEVELTAVPFRGLTLDLGAGYANAEISDAAGVAGVNVGDKIQGVPNWTFSGAAEYVWGISDELEGLFRADFNHYGRSFSANNESSAATQRLRPAWSAINLRLGVMKENWEVVLFVDNLTDTRANLGDNRSIAAEKGTRPRIVTNRPRTVGLETRFRF